MLAELHSVEIKGYQNVCKFMKILADLEYLFNYHEHNNETKIWKIYYSHWNEAKNKKIDGIPGEVSNG